MSTNYESEDIYVLLDFQDKDTSILGKQRGLHFRMLNLNENKPTVEIGQDIYEGVYDDALGTNVFFEEVDDPQPKKNLFEGPTPISLKYFLKQTKVLKLTKIGTKSHPVLDTSPIIPVAININEDYRVLLEKLEKKELNIEDYIKDVNVEESNTEQVEKMSVSNEGDEEEDEEEEISIAKLQWESTKLPPRQDVTPDWFVPAAKSKPESSESTSKVVDSEPPNPVYEEYERLRQIAEQPVHRQTQPETIEDNQYEKPITNDAKRDFIIWKNLILQHTEEQPINLDVNKDSLADFVDIENSIKLGIIAPSKENPRIFTREEKQALLGFKNFINVSPLMKLIMLQDYTQSEEASISQMSEEQLMEMGEDGCTATERVQLIKHFANELKVLITARAKDAQFNCKSLQDIEEIQFTLSSADELSETDESYTSEEDDIISNYSHNENEQSQGEEEQEEEEETMHHETQTTKNEDKQKSPTLTGLI